LLSPKQEEENRRGVVGGGSLEKTMSPGKGRDDAPPPPPPPPSASEEEHLSGDELVTPTPSLASSIFGVFRELNTAYRRDANTDRHFKAPTA